MNVLKFWDGSGEMALVYGATAGGTTLPYAWNGVGGKYGNSTWQEHVEADEHVVVVHPRSTTTSKIIFLPTPFADTTATDTCRHHQRYPS